MTINQNKTIVFSAQHNGKGKNHLIREDDGKELCGTSGTFLFTAAPELHLENGKFYEVFLGDKIELNKGLIELEYCKKCIKKAQSKH